MKLLYSIKNGKKQKEKNKTNFDNLETKYRTYKFLNLFIFSFFFFHKIFRYQYDNQNCNPSFKKNFGEG